MKKYTTPLLAQYAIATEGLMEMSLKTPKSAAGTLDGANPDTFEKQFSIWGGDQSADESEDLDFNSTGIF